MDANELSERLLAFAARCLKLCDKIGRGVAGRCVSGQLTRSSTSAGANYEEACGAESRADFLHKLQISLKEVRESRYWLRLTREAQLQPAAKLSPLMTEADELVRILSKSVVTAKRQSPP
jgi:four helix bundle protein